MNPIEYKITLDCRRAESQVIITAKQGEASGRKITFSLNEGRLPYKVPSGVTAVLRAKKPSGAVLYNTCTVTADGNVEYIITTQTVAEVGKLPCELQLSQDGRVIFTPNFTLLVYKNLAIDSEVESSDEYTALIAALERAESVTDGSTFTPSVSEDGILSWTNDGGKSNPDPVNIKGPQGEKGDAGTFLINVAYSNGVYSADKTFDEIKAAYDAGQQPYVVLKGDASDLVYTLAVFYVPSGGSGQGFIDFERHLIMGNAVETETLRIYPFITESGSNIERQISAFNVPSGTTYVKVDSTDDVITTVLGETYSDIKTLIDAGKPVVVRWDVLGDFYYFDTFGFSDSSGIHRRLNFRCVMGDIVYTLTLKDDNTWFISETSLQSKSITDSGGYYTTDTVEGALQEIGAGLAGTYSKPSSGIPKTDLAEAVQTSLGKADTALQEHQSLAGYATEAWVTGKGYQTETQVKATIKADSDIKANTSARHSHSNKSVLDGITSAIVTAWNNAVTWITTNGENVLSHITDNVKHITAAERTAWNGKSNFSGSYNDLTDKPSALKNPNALTIKIGSTTVTYDGSAAKTVEIADGSEVSY